MEIVNPSLNIDEFLCPTQMCDSNNPFIITKALNLTEGATTNKEKAMRIFYFVRDKIKYQINPYFSTASRTLNYRHGFCVSKSNLQIALLRALNIPARYHVVNLQSSCLNPFFPNWIVKNFPEIIDHHSICECFLNNTWVACDSTFDKDLIDGAKIKGILSQDVFSEIDWDGEGNLEIFDPWKVSDVDFFSNLDRFWGETIQRRYSAKLLVNIIGTFGAKHLDFIRELD